MAPSSTSRLLMGRIGAAHGIKGEVRVQSFAEVPLDLKGFGPLQTDRAGLVIEITNARDTGKGILVCRLKGVPDRTAVEKLNGVELYIDRAQLPAHDDDDDYYHVDLIGLEVRTTGGTTIGRVTAVPNFGAGDILEVKNDGGEPSSFRSPRQWCRTSTCADGYLVIEPPLDADPGEEEPD